MRGLTRALVCIGSLAALSSPAIAAPAQAAPAATVAQVGSGTASAKCRVFAARPTASEESVTALVARAGCFDKTFVEIQIRQARFGVDRILRKVNRVVRNGKVRVSVDCTDRPRTYYVIALDREGNFSKSGKVRLSCEDEAAENETADETQDAPNTRDDAPAESNTQDANFLSAEENEVVRLTNQARRTEGCEPLSSDAKLRLAARNHSADMSRRNFFDHNTPEGRDPGDRIRASGFSPIRSWGENIAAGQRTAAEVVQAWLDSPGHRRNIMNCGFTHIGVGAVKGSRIFWTQNFGSH